MRRYIIKKKLIAILAAATMVFAFVGCGSGEEETTAETTVEETTEAATDDIGIDKATEIALADAGFSAGEVEFTKGETRYEYDIDAATGKILESDTDSIYDD